MDKNQTILVGLNEINFEYIEYYVSQGKLPTFKKIFKDYGYKETTSESKYKLLEPWIQWVTVHTGKSYEEHQVFRLGDIVGRNDLDQLWEVLENKGLSIGAISPFNADNRCKNACFFAPDPWTQTKAAGEPFLVDVAKAVSQAVNNNAGGRISKNSIKSLLKAFLKVVPVANYLDYMKLVASIKSRVGVKAHISDKLLADLFIQQWKKHRPDFSSLFLNSGAHFQHHYMFNSQAYDGDFTNPEWYCPKGQDPLYHILSEYDKVLNRILKLGVRLIIATGLHQKPHKHMTYYWRLSEHENFLNEIGANQYKKVIPRMSRDFLVECNSEDQAKEIQTLLESMKSTQGEIQIFTIDNRGQSLFVELTYPNDIPEGFSINGKVKIDDFRKYIDFVAIKNGEHDGVGYFVDTRSNDLPDKFPLTQVFDYLVETI